jgi:hypothetical protein
MSIDAVLDEIRVTMARARETGFFRIARFTIARFTPRGAGN